MHRYLSAFFILFFATAIAAAEEKTYPVQVIDTGNALETVSLANDPKTGEKHTWFASLKPVDPLKFSAKLLQGDKRKDICPEDFKPVQVPENLLKVFGLQPKPTVLWYYKAFIAPSNPRATLALRLGKINDTDEVYLNGILIGKSGGAGPNGELPGEAPSVTHFARVVGLVWRMVALWLLLLALLTVAHVLG